MSDLSLKQFRAMLKALKRLTSLEAFAIDCKKDEELLLRIDYARETLEKLNL